MQVENPQLGFPNTFCCNCGATDCKSEDQDTRVTRFFSIGRTDTIFRLSVPTCAACRRTLRRRPAGFFSRLGILLLFMAVIFGVSFASIPRRAAVVDELSLRRERGRRSPAHLGLLSVPTPESAADQLLSTRANQERARCEFSGLMAGEGHVRFMRLAFTNPDYLSAFTEANQEAIRMKRVAITKA